MTFKRFTYKAFSIFSLLIVMWMIATTVFIPKMGSIFGMFRTQHSYKMITVLNVSCLLFSCFVYTVLKLMLKKRFFYSFFNNKRTYLFLLIESVLYFILLLAFFKVIGFVNPVDDTRITLTYLDQLNTNGHLGYDYMYSNPQNIFLMYIFNAIQIVFGKNYSIIIVVFCVLHIVTILLSFFSLTNLGISNAISLLTVQLWFFSAQISMHVGVAYTDVLALFFLSVSLFFLTKFLSRFKELDIPFAMMTKKKWLYLIFVSATLTVGYIGKGTFLIVILAFFLAFFIVFKGWAKLISLLPILFFVLGSLGWKQFVVNQQIFPDDNFGQPNTHYIMMGLSNSKRGDASFYTWVPGVYNSDDQAFTWQMYLEEKKSKNEISKKHFDIIRERFEQMSFIELLSFINHKVAVTWSSGDLKSTFEMTLGADSKKNRMTLLYNDSSGLILYLVMMTIQYCIYIGIMLSSVKFFRQFDILILLCNIFIAGYFCFLIFWEASPRYAMLLFPLAVMMIGKYLQSKTSDQNTSYNK